MPISFVIVYRYLENRKGRLMDACHWTMQGLMPGDQIIVVDQTPEPSPEARGAKSSLYIHDPRPAWNMAAALNFGIRVAANEWICLISLDFDMSSFPEMRPKIDEHLVGDPYLVLGLYPHDPYGLIFRKSTWERVGGFDECFDGWGWEDVDFLRRALAADTPLVVVRDIGFPHIPHPHLSETTEACNANAVKYRAKWGDTINTVYATGARKEG